METPMDIGHGWRVDSVGNSQGKHELLKLARETETCDGDWDGQTVLEATDHLAKPLGGARWSGVDLLRRADCMDRQTGQTGQTG